MTSARRRGLILMCFAVVCGGLAASQVHQRERRAEAAAGPLVSAVVARGDLSADHALSPGDLAIRRVPGRFAPPDVLRAPGQLAGARTAVPVAAGAYLTPGVLQGAGASSGSGPLRSGQRAVELPVASGGDLTAAEPGARVDVLVSVQRQDGAGRTFVALENVELLGLRAGSGEPAPEAGAPAPSRASAPGAPAPGALATLRVTARQAVYLAAAANFATEVRLLVRPPGDRRRIGGAAVEESGL